jgi:hypothetical protein
VALTERIADDPRLRDVQDPVQLELSLAGDPLGAVGVPLPIHLNSAEITPPRSATRPPARPWWVV